MKRYTDYEPETVGEEFMLMLGRLEALGIYLDMEDSKYVDHNTVAAIMGIELEDEKNEGLEKYLEKLYSDREKYRNWKNWMFGAIDFAMYSGLINEKHGEELFNKYELI